MHTEKPSIIEGFSFPTRRLLACDVREESHETCALDGDCQLALVLGGDTRALPRKDASVRIQEFLQDLGILVVDIVDIMLAEVTLLFHNGLNECDDLKRYIVGVDLFARIVDLVFFRGYRHFSCRCRGFA